MKYLLLTTPTGGWFPTLYTHRTDMVNTAKLQLEQLVKEFKGDRMGEAAQKFLSEIDEGLHAETFAGEAVHRPGIYQWHEAFNKDGDVGQVKHMLNIAPEDLEDYDIIHVNLCGADVNLVPQVKEALRASSVTVIANLDYAIESFQQSFASPAPLYKSLAMADFVFATEPAQAAYINLVFRHALDQHRDKVSVPVIPHPIDVGGLRHAFVPHEHRMDKVVVCYHRYDGHLYIPSSISWNLEAKRQVKDEGGKVSTQLIRVPRYCAGVGGAMSVPFELFDGWITGINWESYLYELSHSTIGMDYYSIHSHDRFVEECAALEIPCVGTSNSYSMQTLNPYTCHNMLDFAGMRQSLLRLIEDEEFYGNCATMAYEHVQALDHKPSKARLLIEMNKWLQLEGKKR